MVQGPVDAGLGQAAGHRVVAAPFVHGPFGVGVDRRDPVFAAEPRQRIGHLVPGIHGQQLQGNAEPGQVARQRAQVAQPEVDLGRGVAMQAPLARRGNEQGGGGAFSGRGRQGGVVVQAQVGAQPDQGMHAGGGSGKRGREARGEAGILSRGPRPSRAAPHTL